MARDAVDGMDYVLHQAAIPSVPRSVQDPITSNRANIDASLNVLVAARDAGVKRLVYAGSSSAYGNTPTLPKVEDMPTAPLSPYALQKLVAEQYCQMFTRLYGLRNGDASVTSTCSARGRTVVAVLRRDLAVRHARCSTAGSRRFTVTASRRATSPTSPTSSTACCGRARRRSASGEVINVATGGRISLNKLFRRDARSGRRRRRADIRGAACGRRARTRRPTSRKAKRLLGYTPIVSFEDGISLNYRVVPRESTSTRHGR